MTKELTQKEFARLGGKAKLKKHGKKAFSEMGKKSGLTRRLKRDKRLSTGGVFTNY